MMKKEESIFILKKPNKEISRFSDATTNNDYATFFLCIGSLSST